MFTSVGSTGNGSNTFVILLTPKCLCNLKWVAPDFRSSSKLGYFLHYFFSEVAAEVIYQVQKEKTVIAITIVCVEPLKCRVLNGFFLVEKRTVLRILGRVNYFKWRLFCISPPLYSTLGFGQSYSISWPYTKICIYNQFSKFNSFEFILIHWKLIFLVFNHLDVIHIWCFTTSLFESTFQKSFGTIIFKHDVVSP